VIMDSGDVAFVVCHGSAGDVPVTGWIVELAESEAFRFRRAGTTPTKRTRRTTTRTPGSPPLISDQVYQHLPGAVQRRRPSRRRTPRTFRT